ncbi:DUF488 domain-containing protein [Oenococcus alcoholitolerans]|uniref:DUF488 domain-containing protein n=1 Tax=Oenococcus alcoholitolerans TaxID=931074 RepID=UPI003F700CE4
MNKIKIQRIYKKPINLNGYRILVDRLWPRGVSKEKAQLDVWFKDIAPTTELRKWYSHDPKKFEEFKNRYLNELKKNQRTKIFLDLVSKELLKKDVILLFAAKDEKYNQAIVLKNFCQENIEL